MTINLGPHIQTGPVRNRPFRARFEAEHIRSGWLKFLSQRWSGSIDRDSHGRVRTQFERKGKPFATSISDPIAGVFLVRDEIRGARQEIPWSNPPEPGKLLPPENCQFRTIEGLVCFRYSIPGVVDEGWVSEELQHEISETCTKDGRTTTWRLSSIERTEPPAGLFDLMKPVARGTRVNLSLIR